MIQNESTNQATEQQTKTKEKTDAETPQHNYSTTVYQCPMKCEEDKTYAEAGKCPKCGMDLAKVEK